MVRRLCGVQRPSSKIHLRQACVPFCVLSKPLGDGALGKVSTALQRPVVPQARCCSRTREKNAIGAGLQADCVVDTWSQACWRVRNGCQQFALACRRQPYVPGSYGSCIPLGAAVWHARWHELPEHGKLIYGDNHQTSDCMGRCPYASAGTLSRKCRAPVPGAGFVRTYFWGRTCRSASRSRASNRARYALPGKLAKSAVEIRSAATICPRRWFARKLQHSTCPRTKPLQ